MMKKLFLLFPLFFWLLTACDDLNKGTSITADEFAAEIAGGKSQVFDVRTAKEFQEGHIKDALQADWNNKPEFDERTAHLDKSKPILVYCAAGTRSASAGDWLRQRGFKVKELKGGMQKWKSENKPVDQTTGEKAISLAEYKVLSGIGSTVLVDFGADWCPPCRAMDPVIKQLKTDLGEGFKLVKIDAGSQMELLYKLKGEKIPTFIIYRNGGETWRKEGIVSIAELKQQLQ